MGRAGAISPGELMRIKPFRLLWGNTFLFVLVQSTSRFALVWLALDTLERSRVARRGRVRGLSGRPEPGLVLRYGLAGASVAAIVWQYERMLGTLAQRVSHDLLGFSIHPFDAARLLTTAALVLLHAAVVWGTAEIGRAHV